MSDIHANLEALQAVLADADGQGADRILCLGDLVGYGPDPVACVDLVRRRCAVALMGNFDQALLHGHEGFALSAGRSLDWTLHQLEHTDEPQPVRDRRRQVLANLPRTHQEGRFQFVHGSPRNPLHEYVFPEDVLNEGKMERIFDLIPHVSFCGHTHLPGVFVQHPGEADEPTWTYHAPEEIGHEWRIDGHKTMINVGSVGQPRDADPRACYVLVEGELVRFRRVDYDVDTTIRKIHDRWA